MRCVLVMWQIGGDVIKIEEYCGVLFPGVVVLGGYGFGGVECCIRAAPSRLRR